jgi:hypothetical protein
MVNGPSNCLYLGTWESGYLLKFDPQHPDKGIESLGKPSASESYIWQLACAGDGRLYGCTYPNCKLVRYDPKTGQAEDLGRLDPKEMYARSIAEATNGLVYVGVGTVRAQVVRFDPATGQSKPLIADAERPPGTAHVYRAGDGRVYASAHDRAYLCDGDVLRPVKSLPAAALTSFRDGRVVTSASIEHGKVVYALKGHNGPAVTQQAKFDGAGVRLFVVGAGPAGHIYGSTALPLEMFEFNPATRSSQDLGNPTSVGGEIYSFANDGARLYLCAYPQSFLSIYEPARSWHYGKTPESNPRGFGYMGDGHLRPRAMVLGPDGRIYVGSLPPYGQTGGAFGIYDPKLDAVTENYRNVITNQGITALCFETDTGTLFGGSSVEAGGGARPVAKECAVFAWDTKARHKLWESVVVPGDSNIGALTAARGRVFGVSRPSNTLFVLDGKTFEVLSRARIPFGHFHDISLAYFAPHQRLYGLAGQSVFSVDPGTFAQAEVGRSPEPISCGFALTDTGLYFGSGTQLLRWRWE